MEALLQLFAPRALALDTKHRRHPCQWQALSKFMLLQESRYLIPPRTHLGLTISRSLQRHAKSLLSTAGVERTTLVVIFLVSLPILIA